MSKKTDGVGPGQPYGTGNRLKDTPKGAFQVNKRDERGLPLDTPQFNGHGGPK